MAFQVTGRLYQRKAGEPIIVSTRASGARDEYNGWNGSGVGVKVGATAPTNISDFSHTVLDTYDPTIFDRFRMNVRYAYTASVDVDGGALDGPISFTALFTKTIPLDSDFVAGRYVWFFTYLADGVIGGLSSAYHII